MKLSTLYKRATTGKITEWTIEIEGNKYRMITGFIDGKKTTSAWTECFGKNVGKANGTTDEQQALAEATAIHRKRMEQKSYENIDDIDQESFFSPMLAHDLLKYKKPLVFPLLSQPKLDGIRCIIKADGMWTRKGKPLVSAPHIFEDLKPFFKSYPKAILDGELYCDKLANDFNKLISLARQTKPTAEDLAESKQYLELHVYDFPSYKGTFNERYHALVNHYLAQEFPSTVVLVKTFTVNSKEEMVAKYEQYMEQGYEGQMLRVPNSKYENKRTNSLLKDKQFVTEEYTIVGMEEGKGNMSGKVGKLYFLTKEGKKFDAAVNGDWAYLAKLLKAKDLIGKEATVKYQNLTEEGKPRFGKVIAIRDYE
jgi:DNA ligase-1